MWWVIGIIFIWLWAAGHLEGLKCLIQKKRNDLEDFEVDAKQNFNIPVVVDTLFKDKPLEVKVVQEDDEEEE